MSDVRYAPIDHPSAWRSADIGGREALTHRLSAEQIEEIDTLLAGVRGRPVETIRQSDFSAPAVNALMKAARDAIMNGHGAVILSGLGTRYSVEDFALLYWGLGTHLGTGVIQSHRGDHIGYVRVEGDGPVRGYTTDMELRSHTDFHEILSLATMQTSASGGESGIVSALAIHNVIASERPDLLPALYRGHLQVYPPGPGAVVERVPIFSEVNGKVSCFYSRVFMQGSGRVPGDIPADLVEAMAFFDEVAARAELRADFMLERGEILFWHNFQVLHSRQQFQDTADRKRLLLRLWLNVPDGRPMVDAIHRLTARIDEDHALGTARR